MSFADEFKQQHESARRELAKVKPHNFMLLTSGDNEVRIIVARRNNGFVFTKLPEDQTEKLSADMSVGYVAGLKGLGYRQEYRQASSSEKLIKELKTI